MTTDEMRAFVNGLSETERERLAGLLVNKQNEMQIACAFSMTARLV